MPSDAEELPAGTGDAASWRSPPVLLLLGLAFIVALGCGWAAAARLKAPASGAGPRALFSGGGALPILHASLESTSQAGQDTERLQSERQTVQTALAGLQSSIATESQNVEALKKELAGLYQSQGEAVPDPAARKRLAEAKMAMLEKLSTATEALVAAQTSTATMGGMGGPEDLPFDDQSLATWKKEWEALTTEAASQIRSAQTTLASLQEIQTEWMAWSQQPGNEGAFPRLEEAKTRLGELDQALAKVNETRPDAASRLDASLLETEKKLDAALAQLEKNAAPSAAP